MIGKNLTIIGGSGGMGQLFGRYFKQHGFNVTLLARNEKKLKVVADNIGVKYELDLKKSVEDADIVIVSIPISSTGDMVKKVAPLMKKNSLIMDISSLKQEIYGILKEMHKRYPVNCLSIHPMFGPGIKNMRNYVMIVIKVGGTEQYDEMINEFLGIFSSDGIIITETTPDIHDSKIALILGVPHMFNILFLNLLKRTNQSLSELTRYTGTTFLLQKIFAESIIQREMEMFGEIQIENEKFHEILNIFEDLVKEYRIFIKDKDFRGFNNLFTEALEYSKEDNHFKNSYEHFYEFMRILKEKNE